MGSGLKKMQQSLQTLEMLVLGCIDADFASKYSLESSCRDLQYLYASLYTSAQLRPKKFSKIDHSFFENNIVGLELPKKVVVLKLIL